MAVSGAAEEGVSNPASRARGLNLVQVDVMAKWGEGIPGRSKSLSTGMER